MTDINKLNHIKRHCLELSMLATRRTKGEWLTGHSDATGRPLVFDGNQQRIVGAYNKSEADITYIGACAGNAEAGWRATIHAINTLLALYKLNMKLAGHSMMQIAGPARQNLTQIRSGMSDMITPWNEILFTNPTKQ